MKLVSVLLVTALSACGSSAGTGDDVSDAPDAGTVDASVVASPDLGKFCPMGCNLDTCVDTTSSDCENHTCVWDGRGDSFGDAYCSQSCESAGCPTGYACLPAEDGTGKFCFADPAVCGDGVVQRGEVCDAGATNGMASSGCSADCKRTISGGRVAFKYDGGPIAIDSSNTEDAVSGRTVGTYVEVYAAVPSQISLGIRLSTADLTGPFPKKVQSYVDFTDLYDSWCFSNPASGFAMIVTVTQATANHVVGTFDTTLSYQRCTSFGSDPAVNTRAITESAFDVFLQAGDN
ncbi:MAG TPA: hypothetical protein VGM90_18675 [Kofleriaceae bacterium]|jgi:cysteine-rich repeat protein